MYKKLNSFSNRCNVEYPCLNNNNIEQDLTIKKHTYTNKMNGPISHSGEVHLLK